MYIKKKYEKTLLCIGLINKSKKMLLKKLLQIN